jgi:hypothetical protein
LGIFCIGFISLQGLQAGTVRTVYSDNVTIVPVNLRMGQSTILRFIEKPKKVVLGNSNYYSVEFIDNDLAIQPLGTVTTNLFVYGMKNVYGFILKTNQSESYDDLVQVDLKENKVNSQLKLSVMPSPFKETSRPRLTFQVGNELKVTLSRVQRFDGKDFYVIDFQLENTSKKEIDLSKIEILLSRGKLKLSPQEFLLRETKLKSGEFTGARIFISINKRADVNLEVHFKGTTIRQIISGRFL